MTMTMTMSMTMTIIMTMTMTFLLAVMEKMGAEALDSTFYFILFFLSLLAAVVGQFIIHQEPGKTEIKKSNPKNCFKNFFISSFCYIFPR